MRGLHVCIGLLLGMCAQAAFASDWLDRLQPYLHETSVRKLALVISAENYRYIPHVENATNDGLLVQSLLTRAGFVAQYLPEPKSKGEILGAVQELARTAQVRSEPAVVVVFYAGHGFQAAAFNYIVPLEASPDAMLRDSVSVSDVIRLVTPGQAGISVVFLDSCRTPQNAPLAPVGQAGFAQPPSETNVVVGLAANYNQPAKSSAPGSPDHSPYTSGLQQYLPQQGRPLTKVLEGVRTHVAGLTANEQVPIYVSGATASSFYFNAGDKERTELAAVWRKVLDGSLSRACLKRFLDDFPGNVFSKAALLLLEATTNPSEARTCPELD